MKKALKYLDSHNIDYVFHDYKKNNLNEDAFNAAIAEHGWEAVINKRGTTWRKLDTETQSAANNDNAITLAKDNPSLIKRPLLMLNGKTYLGFSEKVYDALF